ncbi:UNVERIFIED_CONTAM: hypothetical protein ACS92_02620 [Bacillus cereus]
MGSKLEDSSLTVDSRRNGNNISWVWNSSDDSCSEGNVLRGLVNGDDVNRVWSGLVEVWGVGNVGVLGT